MTTLTKTWNPRLISTGRSWVNSTLTILREGKCFLWNTPHSPSLTHILFLELPIDFPSLGRPSAQTHILNFTSILPTNTFMPDFFLTGPQGNLSRLSRFLGFPLEAAAQTCLHRELATHVKANFFCFSLIERTSFSYLRLMPILGSCSVSYSLIYWQKTWLYVRRWSCNLERSLSSWSLYAGKEWQKINIINK